MPMRKIIHRQTLATFVSNYIDNWMGENNHYLYKCRDRKPTKLGLKLTFSNITGSLKDLQF